MPLQSPLYPDPDDWSAHLLTEMHSPLQTVLPAVPLSALRC